MKWKGINPYVCTFNRLVDAFGKEGKMKEVRNVLFKAARAIHHASQGSESQCKCLAQLLSQIW